MAKKNIETTTIEPKEPCLISTTDYVMQENKRLKKCIMLLVNYLDALVKARSKLADIERMLKR